LDKFLGEPDIVDITTTDIRRFIDHHLTTNSDSTARQRYGSLSVFFGWLLRLGGFHGSSSILIDGIDPFATENPRVGYACRIYMTETGPAVAPTVEQITTALGV
jgi:hypothetical protein